MKVEQSYVPCPERIRRIPGRFSWVDQRVVRDGYVFRADSEALGLYLVLVTVADRNGLSYYRDRSLGKLLSCNEERIGMLRRKLIDSGLIAYRRPFYQVLSLSQEEPPQQHAEVVVCEPVKVDEPENTASTEEVSEAVSEILRRLNR